VELFAAPIVQNGSMTVTSLTSAVEQTIAEMGWLTPADVALQTLALKLAGEIDSARARADEYTALDGRWGGEEDEYWRLQRLEAWCDLSKSVALLGPKLRDVLRDLGGAPNARVALDTVPKTAGKLALMQANAQRFELIEGGGESVG
jgi:hypothetical protein